MILSQSPSERPSVRTLWWELLLDGLWVALFIVQLTYAIVQVVELPSEIPSTYNDGKPTSYASKYIVFIWPALTLFTGALFTLGAYYLQTDVEDRDDNELWVDHIYVKRTIARTFRESFQILFLYLMVLQVSYAENPETKINWTFIIIFMVVNVLILIVAIYLIRRYKIIYSYNRLVQRDD